MNFSSKLLQDAVDEISRLPGIGKNTATRLALNLIKEKDENVMKLIAAIKSSISSPDLRCNMTAPIYENDAPTRDNSASNV